MNTAEFFAAADSPANLPPETLPEVAVAGRSNCGKSSLINALVQRRKLARTSSTPGRTRQLIFFRVELPGGPPFNLVDLPGYGYAKVSRKLKAEWGEFVTGYVEQRTTLGLVMVLMDIRREPGDEEKDLLGWLELRSLEPLVVLTKADKVPKNRRFGVVQAVATALELPRRPLAVSAEDPASVDALRRELLTRLNRPAASL